MLAEAYGPVVLKAEGLDLAQPAHRGRRLPLRLRRASARSARPGTPARRAASAARCSAASSRRTPRTRCSAPCSTTAAAARQLSVNWSDESYRKMTTKITIVGTAGRIYGRPAGGPGLPARHGDPSSRATRRGWNVKYTTELTEPGRGSTCAARSTAPSSTTSSGASRIATLGRAQHLRQRRRHRPGARAAHDRRRARPVDDRRRDRARRGDAASPYRRGRRS